MDGGDGPSFLFVEIIWKVFSLNSFVAFTPTRFVSTAKSRPTRKMRKTLSRTQAHACSRARTWSLDRWLRAKDRTSRRCVPRMVLRVRAKLCHVVRRRKGRRRRRRGRRRRRRRRKRRRRRRISHVSLGQQQRDWPFHSTKYP